MRFLFFMLFAGAVFADGNQKPPNLACRESLGPIGSTFFLFNSGRDTGIYHKNLANYEEINYGIARDLGLTIPNAVVVHLNPPDMIARASFGGMHAAPVWMDGQKIVSSGSRLAGVLETVLPGQDFHYQIVRDTNSLHETALVYAHVVGHYDFAEHSALFRVRKPDPVPVSYRFAKLVSELKATVGHAEVVAFYHQLETLASLQTFSRPGFDAPEALVANPRERKYEQRVYVDEIGRIQQSVERHSMDPDIFPTRSVLQAYVANMPSHFPTWKKRMAVLFEERNRIYPAIMQTKIMNEGWATILENIILPYSHLNSPSDNIKFGNINSGVAYPKLSNPYWFGRELWRHLRTKWEKENAKEFDGLELKEIDRKFIAMMHKVFENHWDNSIIRKLVDEDFVRKHKYFLYRVDPNSRDPKTNKPMNVVVTTDPQRIAAYIANKLTNFEMHFPTIYMESLNYQESGVVRLTHEPYLKIPLDLQEAAKSLYQMSHLFERPVSIDTIQTGVEQVAATDPAANEWLGRAAIKSQLKTRPLVLQVSPSGDVKATLDGQDAPELAKALKAGVDAFRFELAIGSPEKREKATEDYFAMMVAKEAGGVIQQLPEVMGHAPTAGEAVMEYLFEVKKRMGETLRLAAEGKWGMIFSNNGKSIKLRALPQTPTFILDHKYMKSREGMLPSTPVDSLDPTPSNMGSLAFFGGWGGMPAPKPQPPKLPAGDFLADEDLDMSAGDALPGDHFPAQPQGQGGGGEGEGEEGDGEAEDSESSQGGSESGNPVMDEMGMVRLPVEALGRILAEQLQLRNLRQVIDGKDLGADSSLQGGVQRAGGILVDELTQEKAIEKGMAIARQKGMNPFAMTPVELYKMGIVSLEPAEEVVLDRQPEPGPTIRAVVVYAADTSGSMSLEHRKIMRKMINYERAFLRWKYPHVEERFVIFSTEAEEVDEETFFQKVIDGGTLVHSGVKHAAKILKDYDPARFNRYFRLFSDGGDAGIPETLAEMKKLVPGLEHSGYGHIDPSGQPGGELSAQMKALSVGNQRLDYTELSEDVGSILRGLKTFYGPKEDVKSAAPVAE